MLKMKGKISAEDLDDVRDVQIMIRHDLKRLDDEDTLMGTRENRPLIAYKYVSPRYTRIDSRVCISDFPSHFACEIPMALPMCYSLML